MSKNNKNIPRRAGKGTGGHGGGRGFEKPKNARMVFSRLFGYIIKNKLLLLLVAVLVIFSSGSAVFGTYMLKPIINIISDAVKSGSVEGVISQIVPKLIFMGIIFAVGVVSQYIYARLMLNLSQSTLNTIRRDLFEHLQDLPVSFFDSRTHGEVMSRFSNDVDTLREAITQGLPQMITSAVSIVGIFVMMLVISPPLTLLVVVLIIIVTNLMKFIGKRSASYFRKQQEAVGKVNGYVEELIEGQKVVKVFCRERQTKEGFDALNEEYRKAATNAHTYASILMPIMNNISYVNYAVTSIVGAVMIVNGGIFGIGVSLSLGSLVSFLQYTRQFFQPLTMVSQQFNNLLAALAGAERIFEIIDLPPEEDDGYVTLVNAAKDSDGNLKESEAYTGMWAWKHPHSKDGSVTYTELRGEIVFDDVTFSYDGETEVLKNITLKAESGQKIAFVGSTGAGKTTITNLLNRFYDVPDGKIRYDGINIKKIKKDDLRRSLAMVLQDTHLFTGSIKDNIAYGKLDATDDEIIAAAKLANAHSFIEKLPQGYDTLLSSDGTNISQGQRQLLSIARAAVANPPVLVLDEATSSIDTRTERLIEKGMDKLMENRTVFVIAHRLSTVRNSDKIIVLEHGEIIEQGNHEHLLALRGKYYSLYTGQFVLD